MKIERINENQIKIIMSAQDLKERNINLSEVKYGSEKGQELFAEFISHIKEYYDFDLDENTPYIVEAIPMSKTEITFIISKVTQAMEFEKGFNFLPKTHNERKFANKAADDKQPKYCSNPSNILIYVFKKLDDIIDASIRLDYNFNGDNSLYKMDKKYYLIANAEVYNLKAFNLLESVLSDYGEKYKSTPIAETYIKERGELISTRTVQNFAACFGD